MDIQLSEGDEFSMIRRRNMAPVSGLKKLGRRVSIIAGLAAPSPPQEKSPRPLEESFNFSKVANKLRDVQLFEKLSLEDLDRLVEQMIEIRLEREEWVFREGEPGDALFIIKRGTASVLKLMQEKHEQIAALEQWSVFGERALLKGELRFAGVQATSETLTVMKLTQRAFVEAMGVPLQEILNEQKYDSAEKAVVHQRKLQRAKTMAIQNSMKKQSEMEKSAILIKKLERMFRRTVNPRGRFLIRWDMVMMIGEARRHCTPPPKQQRPFPRVPPPLTYGSFALPSLADDSAVRPGLDLSVGVRALRHAAMWWTATATPFEICFVQDRTMDAMTGFDWVIFALNRVIDSIFLIDICLTFFVPFRESPRKGGRWVYDSKRIAASA